MVHSRDLGASFAAPISRQRCRRRRELASCSSGLVAVMTFFAAGVSRPRHAALGWVVPRPISGRRVDPTPYHRDSVRTLHRLSPSTIFQASGSGDSCALVSASRLPVGAAARGNTDSTQGYSNHVRVRTARPPARPVMSLLSRVRGKRPAEGASSSPSPENNGYLQPSGVLEEPGHLEASEGGVASASADDTNVGFPAMQKDHEQRLERGTDGEATETLLQESQAQEEEEISEKQGERGAGEKTGRGLFTYDWENGKRVTWVASKRSQATVVSESNAGRTICCIVEQTVWSVYCLHRTSFTALK